MSYLAELCGFSYSYFSRSFQRLMHRSIPDYLNSLRVAEAEKLLISTSLTVTDIALATGFETSSYFIKNIPEIQTTVAPPVQKNHSKQFYRISVTVQLDELLQVNGCGNPPKESFHFLFLRQGFGKRRGAPCRKCHPERIIIIFCPLPSRQKSGDHGISGADAVDQRSFRGRRLMKVPVRVQKNSAFPRKGDKNIFGASS